MLNVVEVTIEDRIQHKALQLMEQTDILRNAQLALDAVKSELIELVGIKEEGSQSFNVNNFKITTSQTINRTCDQNIVRQLLDDLPEDVHKNIFEYKASLNLKNYRALHDMNPTLAAQVDRAITSRAGKPSVKVEIRS